LTSTAQISNPRFRDSSRVTSSSACAEASVLSFRTVKSWRGRISVLCSSAVHSSLVCERPGPGYSRAVFVSDDLALRGNSCSFATNRQSPLLDKGRSLPALGSSDKCGYPGCDIGGKYFLFGACLSGQWTALGSRWTHNELGGANQCLHVSPVEQYLDAAA
jgi:hypothetical protein